MRLPRSFDQLLRVPPDRRAAMQAALLARVAREEWPLVPALRARLQEAGLDADRARPADRLAGLAPLSLDRMGAAPPPHLRPTPDPARIRRHWGAGRKFGLVLARGKGGALLQRGYVPVPEATDQIEDLAVESTQHDLELLREQLIRCALLLGLTGRTPIAAEGALLPAALRAALPTAAHPEEAPRRAQPAPLLLVADPSTMEDALSRASDPDSVLCVAEHIDPRWPTAVWSPALRLLLPAVEGRRALLFDDLVALEHDQESGLIIATHLAHHGTMLARVLLPGTESWELLPAAGSGLPLVTGL